MAKISAQFPSIDVKDPAKVTGALIGDRWFDVAPGSLEFRPSALHAHSDPHVGRYYNPDYDFTFLSPSGERYTGNSRHLSLFVEAA
ncbi:hypothetical protein ACPCIZ_12815 [Streptomyces cellulosae]